VPHGRGDAVTHPYRADPREEGRAGGIRRSAARMSSVAMSSANRCASCSCGSSTVKPMRMRLVLAARAAATIRAEGGRRRTGALATLKCSSLSQSASKPRTSARRARSSVATALPGVRLPRLPGKPNRIGAPFFVALLIKVGRHWL
jgi:hypothetical protein